MMRQSLTSIAFIYLALFAASASNAQTYSVVYNFGSQVGDPFSHTFSGIIAQGRDGNLYSSSQGGQFDHGANFMVTPAGVLTTLYSFTDGADGSLPLSGLTLGTDGNFYGTSSGSLGGGAPNGTIFRMSPSGVVDTLYTFTDGSDGSSPDAPPIEGADRNFYGTTCGYTCGGITASSGSIYKITLSGVFTILRTCTTDCTWIPAPLVQGTDGAFYDVSIVGGSSGYGSIFKITAGGAFTVLYSFAQEKAGGASSPVGPLIQASDGNFYGTTKYGGLAANPCGIVFKMTPKGALTVIHSMRCGIDGGTPYAGLIQATDGNLYGVNSKSAKCRLCGNILKVTPGGAFSVVYDFENSGSALWAPYSTLFQHTNGLIYGMTFYGGTGRDAPYCTSCGVVFSLDIGASPFVSLVSRAAQVGKTIQILGQGFTGSTSVAFNGVPATFHVVSNTFLTALVPTGATSGPVAVTTPAGTLTSNVKFYVLP
jgi:uncharacterized repeat protein (TIGR03803 family)